jgi:hypothetical protein
MSVTTFNLPWKAADLSEGEIEVLRCAGVVAEQSLPVSDAIQACLMIIRTFTTIRHPIRSAATTIILESMQPHHKDTCSDQDEHVELVLEWRKALIDPANNMHRHLAIAEMERVSAQPFPQFHSMRCMDVQLTLSQI